MTLCQYYPKKYLQLFFLGGLKRYLTEGLYFPCEPLFISYGKERENTMCCKFKEMVIIRSGENFTKGKLKLHKSNLRDKSVNSVRNESSGSNHNTSFSVDRGLPLNNTFQESYPTYKFR